VSEPGDILWWPSAARIAASNIAAFAKAAGLAPDDADGLHRWSVNEPGAFHDLLWRRLAIIGDKGRTAHVPAAALRDVRFFPEARLNYAENLLANPDDRPAIIAHRDDGTRRELSRAELHALVSRIAQALRAEGIAPGDRIAAIVSNDIEAIAVYLASAAVGAIWASCSPDFGPTAASDRLTQLDPAILVAVSGYTYADKQIDTTATIDAVASCASIRKIIAIGPEGGRYPKPTIGFDAWLEPYAAGDIAFHRQAFNAPLAILFSSGTTGKPKCIVHRAGGLLLQHKKEQVLHCDLRENDRLFYYTTCGWMMWNWLVTGLASKATIVTYDGNPTYPTAARLPDLIDGEAIGIFGTSAKYIDSVQRTGLAPARTHSLASLKTILSTGSPLLPQAFDHVYADWKADLHLASISGGTDICGCFLGGNPLRPVRRGELQGPMLGLDVAVFDDNGQPVRNATGELVCRNAHVSMPVEFWGDETGERYRHAYFDRFAGVWAHGDFAEQRDSGGFVIYGRSDTTLNPGGVRVGTAEIYRQLESIPQILEAAAVGQDWQGDQRIILFVRLKPGEALTETLQSTIRTSLRRGASPRHVPAIIFAVSDLPRTHSGKISEVAIRDTIHGRTVINQHALANPESLADFRDYVKVRN
jgi:acetoacetyl-CoA synthetase